jgi:hypothetical protein
MAAKNSESAVQNAAATVSSDKEDETVTSEANVASTKVQEVSV